jgi:hypothetical protein
MFPAILILLVIAILFGVGLAVAKFLLWVAAILFVIWVIGWFVGAGAAAGDSRRWYSW